MSDNSCPITPPKRDYYEVLSVERDCDDQTLKSAYRKLALQYHPDRTPGDADAENRFKEAAEAYAVLSKPDRRASYDKLGHEGVSSCGCDISDEIAILRAELGDSILEALTQSYVVANPRERRQGLAGKDLIEHINKYPDMAFSALQSLDAREIFDSRDLCVALANAASREYGEKNGMLFLHIERLKEKKWKVDHDIIVTVIKNAPELAESVNRHFTSDEMKRFPVLKRQLMQSMDTVDARKPKALGPASIAPEALPA